MPSQEVIDGLWKLGATIVFFGFAGVCTLIGLYVNKKWF